MAYKLSRLAAQDFSAIYEYTLLNFGAAQADAYTADLKHIFQLLDDSPLIGKNRDDISLGLRQFFMQKHVIFYRGRKDRLFISRILHEKILTKAR